MNMKKTIAAIAAGAVAVSAMATSVSALENTTFAYSLVNNTVTWPWTAGSATYEFTINAAAGSYPTYIQLANKAANGTDPALRVDNMIVKVASNTAGEQNKIYTYSSKDDALNYNKNLDAWSGKLTLSNELAAYTGDLTITVTVSGEDYVQKVADINSLIAGASIAGAADAGDVTPVTLKAHTEGKSTKNVVRTPFKTSLTNNREITSYLEGIDVDGNGKHYNNVNAVLNDAIENYETVTFTFNTAAETIGYITSYEKSGDVYTDGYWNGCNAKGNYTDAVLAAGGNADNLIAIYTDKEGATDKYKSFAQHLYTGYYSPEGTGFAGYDWTGYNLFQGALVINEYLTMSLAETDYFDWTATSLSFDWDAVMDGAMTSNDYAVYLHTMKLATSNTWYWDNLVVTCTAGAADDATSDAGTAVDDETLDDTADDEAIDDDEIVADDEDEDEVVADVPAASNPTTGNAPVALAVIPVALAAAAVVAKKRS